MSRKDYIKFAAVFQQARPAKVQREAHDMWRGIRDGAMKVLQEDNPRFDRTRFIAATED